MPLVRLFSHSDAALVPVARKAARNSFIRVVCYAGIRSWRRMSLTIRRETRRDFDGNYFCGQRRSNSKLVTSTAAHPVS